MSKDSKNRNCAPCSYNCIYSSLNGSFAVRAFTAQFSLKPAKRKLGAKTLHAQRHNIQDQVSRNDAPVLSRQMQWHPGSTLLFPKGLSNFHSLSPSFGGHPSTWWYILPLRTANRIHHVDPKYIKLNSLTVDRLSCLFFEYHMWIFANSTFSRTLLGTILGTNMC